MAIISLNKNTSTLNAVLSAAKKLNSEEKHLLRMKLFANDAIKEMKNFEATLKKKRKPLKRKNGEIVAIVKANRYKNESV